MNNWVRNISIVILLVAIVGLIWLEITHANDATRLEISLFNILQFIASLIFAWLVSTIVSESRFQESQRKFAIGSFRRIKEIEKAISRTFDYLVKNEVDTNGKSLNLIEIVKTNLLSVRDTVNSSVADWSDIIGDEIEVSNEIERLKKVGKDHSSIDRSEKEQTDLHESRIRDLYETLPDELKLLIDPDIQNNTYQECIQLLIDEWREKKSIAFEAFWESDDSFQGDLENLKLGDKIYIARGFTKCRHNALFVYNSKNETVAVVTNKFTGLSCGYDEFVDIIESFYDTILLPPHFDGTPLEGVISELNIYDVIDRQYFHFKVLNKPKSDLVI